MASQQKASIDISIIIPAYREEKRIGRTLDELAQYLKTDAVLKTKQIEVIVVSADSPDKTHRLAKDEM
jgi:glycosyltransferase involved in cell wall biosynthesis